MTSNEFVKAIKIQTSDAAIEGTIQCLIDPPGRKPAKKLVRLSEWYKQLDGRNQEMLREALKEAAELAIFEFFCVLDGVSVIEDTPDKGELEVHFLKGTERVLLNDPGTEELHNLFNALCQDGGQSSKATPQLSPYDSGDAQQLKSKLISGDNLDMHHIPDKHSSIRSSKEYDPRTAPAIVLPKPEHRQIPPQ